MNELTVLVDASAMTVLRLVAWANVGVAVVWLVVAAIWLLCLGIEPGRRAANVAR
jgi:hypothetical protein